ncbi:MAG: hypothetical protein Q4B54_02990 [Coriobacteriales bacterium]|nr:hypothetical protein [Coriobacteriales bacterium]
MKRLFTSERAKRVGAALLFLTVFVVLVAALSYVFHPKDNSPERGMMEAKAHAFMGEPENSLDVLFIGDSRVYTSFSPMQMWQEYGFTSHAIGTDSQQMPYTNTLLKRAFAKQKPKVVVFETDFLFMRFRLEDAGFRLLSDYVPFFEYHSRWKNLSLADFVEPIRYSWTDPCKGFKVDATINTEPDEEVRKVAKHKMHGLARYGDVYMERFVKMCHENGAIPVFVSAPSTNATGGEHHEIPESLAKELGMDYLDLNEKLDEVGIDWSHDTVDGGEHLNLYGAEKVSHYVGAYLQESYGLPDHRKDKAYESWNEAYDTYESMLLAQQQ